MLLNGTFGFFGFARQLTPFYPVAAPGVFASLRTRDARLEVRTAVYTAAVGDDVQDNIGFDSTPNSARTHEQERPRK